MKWRFTYTDPANNSFVASDPSGWDSATLILDRHSDFHSLIESFESTFNTYGSNGTEDGGRDWLLAVENTYGADAVIKFLAEIDYKEDGTYTTLYEGTFAVGLFTETLDDDHFLQIVVNQKEFWSQFIDRLDHQIDIRSNQTVSEKALNEPGTVSPTPFFNLPLPSQKINKSYKGFLKFNKVIDMYDLQNTKTYDYCLADFDTDILNEIPQTFHYGWNPTENNSPFGIFVVEDSGDISIDLSITLGVPDDSRNSAGPSAGGLYFFNSLPYIINRTQSAAGYFDVYVQKNLEPAIKCTASNRAVTQGVNLANGLYIDSLYSFVTDYTLQQVFSGLKKNDQIKIFAKRSATLDQKYFESGGSTGFDIHMLLAFGSNGYSPNDFAMTFSGLINSSNPLINAYSQLIEPEYLATGSEYNPDPVTHLPTTNTRDGIALQQGDSFIVGVAAVINGISTEKGWVLQYLGDAISGLGTVPTITCNTGSATVNFSNGNLFGHYFILYDNSGNLIGAIKQWNTTTQAVLTTNSKLNLVAGSIQGGGWWISPQPLFAGTQAYGRTFLNVTYETTAEDAATGLFKAAGTNAYTLTDNSVNAYSNDLNLFVQFANNNTGASTLQVNALAALPIVHADGSALIANDIVATLVASGTNTYAVSNPFFQSLEEGITLTIQITNANTGASTLNLNGFGAIPLYYKGTNIGNGFIAAGAFIQVVYDGTAFEIQDNNGSVTGQIYVLTCTGSEFILTPLSATDNITPTANKTAQAFLTHDVAAGIMDRMTDFQGLFYSELLGSRFTSRVYGSDGCASNTANLKGLHLRGYTLAQKPFFQSFQDWWDGINPIYNLCLLYDKIGGNDVIRVENKAFVYGNDVSVSLSNVRRIKRVYDNDFQFNQIQFGYQKWQSQAASGVGAPSGIDDPQSQRTFSTLFKYIGKSVSYLSTWVAASLTIETTRRIGLLQSANYTYDDDTFVIDLKSNGDGTFTPSLEEKFSSISNLKNPDTRYNSKLTATRNFYRWIDYFSGCLQKYLSSFFVFSSGTGNYDMVSQMSTTCDPAVSIAEGGNIAPTNTPYHSDQLFEIDHYLDYLDYDTIRNNRSKMINISQTESNYKAFVIKNLKYNLITGEIKLLAWSKNGDFKIAVIDDDISEHDYSGARYHNSQFDPMFD